MIEKFLTSALLFGAGANICAAQYAGANATNSSSQSNSNLVAQSKQLFSTLQNIDDPCLLTDKYYQMVGYFPPSLAKECLTSLPSSPLLNAQLIDTAARLSYYYSLKNYISSTNSTQNPVNFDMASALEELKTRNEYNGTQTMSTYSLHTELFKIFNNAKDGYTSFTTSCVKSIQFVMPIFFANLADSPTEHAKIRVAPDLWKIAKYYGVDGAYKYVGLNPQALEGIEVLKIQGIDAAQYIQEFTNNNTVFYGSNDPEYRYASNFVHYSNNKANCGLNLPKLPIRYTPPEGDFIEMLVSDGSQQKTITVPWMGVYNPKLYVPNLDTNGFFQTFCGPVNQQLSSYPSTNVSNMTATNLTTDLSGSMANVTYNQTLQSQISNRTGSQIARTYEPNYIITQNMPMSQSSQQCTFFSESTSQTLVLSDPNGAFSFYQLNTDNTVGIIVVSTFDISRSFNGTGNAFQTSTTYLIRGIQSLKSRGVTKIMIDVTGNGGGFYDLAFLFNLVLFPSHYPLLPMQIISDQNICPLVLAAYQNQYKSINYPFVFANGINVLGGGASNMTGGAGGAGSNSTGGAGGAGTNSTAGAGGVGSNSTLISKLAVTNSTGGAGAAGSNSTSGVGAAGSNSTSDQYAVFSKFMNSTVNGVPVYLSAPFFESTKSAAPYYQILVRSLAANNYTGRWTAPFMPNMITIISDGFCSGACALAVTNLQQTHGIKTVTMGGRPNSTLNMQAAAGPKGAQSMNLINIKTYLEQYAGNITAYCAVPRLPVPGNADDFSVTSLNSLSFLSLKPADIMYESSTFNYQYTQETYMNSMNLWISVQKAVFPSNGTNGTGIGGAGAGNGTGIGGAGAGNGTGVGGAGAGNGTGVGGAGAGNGTAAGGAGNGTAAGGAGAGNGTGAGGAGASNGTSNGGAAGGVGGGSVNQTRIVRAIADANATQSGSAASTNSSSTKGNAAAAATAANLQPVIQKLRSMLNMTTGTSSSASNLTNVLNNTNATNEQYASNVATTVVYTNVNPVELNTASEGSELVYATNTANISEVVIAAQATTFSTLTNAATQNIVETAGYDYYGPTGSDALLSSTDTAEYNIQTTELTT